MVLLSVTTLFFSSLFTMTLTIWPMRLWLLNPSCSFLGLIFHIPELWNLLIGMIRLKLHHLQFLCVAHSLAALSSASRFHQYSWLFSGHFELVSDLVTIPFKESNLLFQCVDFLLSKLQVLTGLLLSFLRSLKLAMHPSEFLLRRTVPRGFNLARPFLFCPLW